MNEIMNVMKERRSIRKFKPDMPSKEDLNQIIEAGLYAASGMGKQAAIIVAVTNKELRDKLSEMNRRIGGWEKGFDPFYGAPAVLVVLADKNCPTHVYDGSLVMGNMMLEAKAFLLSPALLGVVISRKHIKQKKQRGTAAAVPLCFPETTP